jgi:hypothetical protein
VTNHYDDTSFGDDAAGPRDDAGASVPRDAATISSGDDVHEAPLHFPWPPAEGASVLDAWIRTWSGASLRPSRFFAAMPAEGSPGAAIIYYLSIGIPVAGAQLFWQMIGGALGIGDPPAADAAGWSPLVDFLLSPLLLLLSLFLAAGVTHVLLKLFGAAGGNYGRTIRVFAYAYSPNLLGVIPWAGTIVGFAWMVVVAIVGLRTAHGTTTGRAAAAVLVPVSFALFLMMIALLIARAGGLLNMPV